MNLVLSGYYVTPVFVMMLNPEFSFYRVRKNIDDQLEDITSPASYSYPEARFCTENGRANIYGHPTFYCSDTTKVAIPEVRPEHDDILYVSKWNTISSSYALMCNNSCVSENTILNGAVIKANSSIQKKFEETIRVTAKKKLSEVTNDFNNIFRDEYYPYAHSSVYSYLMMYSYNVDMIAYNSFLWKTNLTNLAIKKEFVDKFLRLNKVYKLRVLVDSFRYNHFSLLQVGTINSGKVDWLSPEKYDYYDLMYKFEMGKHTRPWVLSTKEGKLMNEAETHEKFNEVDFEYLTKEMKKFTKKDHRRINELLSLGMEQSQSGNYHKALKFFDLCISQCTFLPHIYYERGICNFHINKHDEAIKDYTNAIRLHDVFIMQFDKLKMHGHTTFQSIYKAHCNRGTLYQIQKKYNKAIVDFTKALEYKLDDVFTIFNMGNCLVEMGKIPDALLYYERALKLKPKDKKIIRGRDDALCLLKKDNYRLSS